MDLLQLTFISLGAVVVFCAALKVYYFLKIFSPKIWCPVPDLFFISLGEWAVVTGATDGIGREYAFELAKRGMNIVLISRTLEKLERVANEIVETTGRKVKVIQADFTMNDIYENVEEQLKGLEIGILVNNVGMLNSYTPCRFLDTENLDKIIPKLINCNMTSLVMMSKIVLPHMLKRQKGLILNLSSGVGLFPCPYYNIYSASKVFVERFSRGLQAEYHSAGVIIQCIAPFGVSTAMTHYQQKNVVTKSAKDFVVESLDFVLLGDYTFGCFIHEILAWIIKAIPLKLIHSDFILDTFLEYCNKRISS
ncbi:17-beta-hydroxysteroid dehydrogenase type 3 [Erpetoichthys calabaricus]|uniref:Hydroxysteroid (17-beta) dehydrogenase 3 n=1 Tax=Erpetoichthys calabaricus TaxID=27687 RepID=A0A8C4RYX0_ERPCA|nr:17-beta-hydroxysteroid dehydrogenase type 3 [Erpetoichthys calabaricus]